jgi:protoheme ferro-lyase
MLVVPISCDKGTSKTLHEINIDGRIDAKKYGIERFRMMPAVGDSPAFIGTLKDVVLQKLGISDEKAELSAAG